MNQYQIAVIVGSLRKDSFNRKLATALAELALPDLAFKQTHIDNAIDHASRPYGKSAWAGKPAGVIGVSVGATGTSMAQQHLRNVLAYLDAPVLGQPEAFIHAKDGLFATDGSIGDRLHSGQARSHRGEINVRTHQGRRQKIRFHF